MFASCKQPEQLGPSNKDVYGPLKITQVFSVNNSNPNFSTGTNIHFRAKFENTTSWKITIVGATSQARKTITGVGTEINASNSTWDGTADDAPSFRVENASATLTVLNPSPPVIPAVNIDIAGKKNLDEGGVLVSDFANNKTYCRYCGPGPNYPNDSARWESESPLFVNTHTTFGTPDGNAYMYLSSAAKSTTSPYIVFMNILAQNADVNYGKYFPLSIDANRVFFNIMVYGTDTPNTWLNIGISEDGQEVRTLSVRPDWTGWKLLSYRYTDIPTTTTTTPRPDRVTGISFVLLSDAKPLPGAAVSTAFDHAIFTFNKPYQP